MNRWKRRQTRRGLGGVQTLRRISPVRWLCGGTRTVRNASGDGGRRREPKYNKTQKTTKGKKKEKQKHHLIFYNEDVFRLPLLFQVLLRTILSLVSFFFPSKIVSRGDVMVRICARRSSGKVNGEMRENKKIAIWFFLKKYRKMSITNRSRLLFYIYGAGLLVTIRFVCYRRARTTDISRDNAHAAANGKLS